MRRILFVFLCIFFLVPSASFAEELTDEKRAAIDELLVATNALKIGSMMSGAMYSQFTDAMAKSDPNLPPKAYEIIRDTIIELVDKELTETKSLQEEMYPMYHKYFTLAELKELLVFYKSQLGAKLVEVTPMMFQEGMEAGQRWGAFLVPKAQGLVLERLKAEGILPQETGGDSQ